MDLNKLAQDRLNSKQNQPTPNRSKKKKKSNTSLSLEEDMRIRKEAQKVTIVTTELHGAKVCPIWSGININPVVKDFFVTDDPYNKGVVEFTKDMYDNNTEKIADVITLNKADVIEVKNYKNDAGEERVRILFNTKKIP